MRIPIDAQERPGMFMLVAASIRVGYARHTARTDSEKDEGCGCEEKVDRQPWRREDVSLAIGIAAVG